MSGNEDETLVSYLAAVRASPHNLVSRRGLDELETRHLAESVVLARALPPGPARVVDVGTGGGFPGFVIAATRADLDVTLVDATGKKVRFLRETATRLGVPVSVVHGRMEHLPERGFAAGFDIATARAVAPLERLVPWALPLLRPGGELWAIKGETWADELEAGAHAIASAGGEVVATPRDRGWLHPQLTAAGASVEGVRVVIIARRTGISA